MIAGLDSSFATPTAAQVAQAKAAGISLWSGYLATKGGVGLAHPWTQANFNTVLQGGLSSIAFCSGNDDPVACKNLAASWGVLPCLDVENGIRADGSWVPGWLAASGAGLYGNVGVHTGRVAAFHILSAYPAAGNPTNASWYPGYARPSGPCGWQWQGTHTEFGATVDRGWYDDYFAQPQPQEEEVEMLIVNTPNEGVWLLSGSMYVHIDTPQVLNSLLATGVKQWTVDEGQHQMLVAASESGKTNPPSLAGSLNVAGTLQVTQ